MKPLIVANWKCNPKNLSEAKKLFDSVTKGIKNFKKSEVAICPPFLYIFSLKSGLKLGAQDCFWSEGAFTGEISASMLKNAGIQYVILGHSERRANLNETDEMINRKLKAALESGLRPILCVANLNQLKKSLEEIENRKLKIENLILAYEPVFAIGTGKACSIEKAKKIRISIRKELGKNIPILYGGSVNSQNAGNYIKEGGFQGLLIGSASLSAGEFLNILKNIDKI